MLNYNFEWTTSDKPTIPLGPLTLDYSTGLVLVGRGAWQSGTELQNNLLKILDHFDSADEPVKPTEGQLWYSRNDAKFKVWDGAQWVFTFKTNTSSGTQPAKPQDGELWYDLQTQILYVFSSGWQQIYPPFSTPEPVRIAFVDEYNYLATKLNCIIGTPRGQSYQFASGYGQTLLPILTSMSNSDWLSLISLAKKIGKKCGVSSTILNSISDSGFIMESDATSTSGVQNKFQEFSALQSMIENLFNARFVMNPSHTHIDSSAAGQVSRTTPWSGLITHEVILSFNSNSDMKAYFNSGAALGVTISVSNTPSGNANTEWNSLASSVGMIIFGASGTTANTSVGTSVKGFYDLTSSYQTIFTKNTPGTYTTGTLKVEVKQETSASIKLLISCTSTSTITSDLSSSQITLMKPSDDVIASPAIQFPTITKQLTSTW